MNFKMMMLSLLSTFVLSGGTATYAQEDSDEPMYSSIHPIAIFPFQERGKEVEELGGKVTDPAVCVAARESCVFPGRAGGHQ